MKKKQIKTFSRLVRCDFLFLLFSIVSILAHYLPIFLSLLLSICLSAFLSNAV